MQLGHNENIYKNYKYNLIWTGTHNPNNHIIVNLVKCLQLSNSGVANKIYSSL